MICQNCGKREANVRYTENINGVKKELNLCGDCSEKLGINDISFNMPIDFSSFFGEFLEDFANPDYMPLFSDVKTLKCNECGYTFDDIVNTGKLGCGSCYDVFEDKLDNIIKKIQGDNKHIGRLGKIIGNNLKQSEAQDKKSELIKTNSQEHEIEKLKSDLKQAVKEERYEDAAKIRDELKKFQ